MKELFFISDTHFSHANILTFTGKDGNRIRPEFSSVEEMDEVMIENWNKTVSPGDKIYHLGDVGFNRNSLDTILPRLNGKKRLILGNHDGFKMDFYAKHFEKVMSERRMDGILFTHRPAFMWAAEPYIKANVHGHIHEKKIPEQESRRHLNISVERTGYRPLSYDEVRAILTDEMGIDLGEVRENA